MKALFVTSSSSMKNTSGGQQVCTQEYLKLLKVAGFSVSIIEYEFDKSPFTRLRRRIFPRPYDYILPFDLVDKVNHQLKVDCTDLIFLNVVDVAPLAKQLRSNMDKKIKIILLSHGLASVDYLHEVRAQGENKFNRVNSSQLRKLSLQLIAECEQRQYIDQVFCLAPFEVEIERWLGAKRVNWLPRIIQPNPLEWDPDSTRLGFVGTVDHPPNKEGLILFLKELEKIAPPNLRLRLVGSPSHVATAIANQFPIVDYLGMLSNSDLEKEARTWSCFVHPIFCFARGCSTKLASAFSWQIPVATTAAGCRGYTWKQGHLSLAETPEDLSRLALKMTDKQFAYSSKQEIVFISNSSPTVTEIAKIFCDDLNL
jgi:hypothetical protein